MKILKYLWLHCTGTKEGYDYSDSLIKSWFRDRGWKHDGYNDVIHLDGSISLFQPYDMDEYVSSDEIANGAKGWNSNARHVSYVGGCERDNHKIPKDTRTPDQKSCLYEYCMQMVRRYPNILIGGHNQVSAKACPSFDVPTWCCHMGIPTKNINFEYLVPHAYNSDQSAVIDYNSTYGKKPFDFDLYGNR